MSYLYGALELSECDVHGFYRVFVAVTHLILYCTSSVSYSYSQLQLQSVTITVGYNYSQLHLQSVTITVRYIYSQLQLQSVTITASYNWNGLPPELRIFNITTSPAFFSHLKTALFDC